MIDFAIMRGMMKTKLARHPMYGSINNEDFSRSLPAQTWRFGDCSTVESSMML